MWDLAYAFTICLPSIGLISMPSQLRISHLRILFRVTLICCVITLNDRLLFLQYLLLHPMEALVTCYYYLLRITIIASWDHFYGSFWQYVGSLGLGTCLCYNFRIYTSHRRLNAFTVHYTMISSNQTLDAFCLEKKNAWCRHHCSAQCHMTLLVRFDTLYDNLSKGQLHLRYIFRLVAVGVHWNYFYSPVPLSNLAYAMQRLHNSPSPS